MSAKQAFYAYIATLIALVVVALIGGVMLALGRDAEALGMTALVTGLIGVLGTFKPATTPPKDDSNG